MRRYQGGISFGPEPTAADLAAAFGLSRTGPGNYNGPCPLCLGDDRFHVHEVDGRAVVGCRGCIDGLAKPERSARYGEVMRLYRGDGRRATRHAPAQAVGPSRPHGAADRIALARKKWASAAPIPTDPEHPARRWLAAHHLWRPELQLPPSVRWLEASGGPSVGGLLAAFAPPGHGQPSGVQLVSVDGDGRPAPDRAGPTGLAKRSIGAMRGAVCVLGLPDAVSGVNVAEGLADVLALASRLPWPADWLAWARSMCGPTWTSRTASRLPASWRAASSCSAGCRGSSVSAWVPTPERRARHFRPWTLRPSSPTPATWSATACRRGKRAAWRR